MMYNNQPDDPSFPPSKLEAFSFPHRSQHFNHPILPPTFNEQKTFAQFPQAQKPLILPDPQHQPDLQRFNRKQRGSMTSRLASLQILRQQVQQQGLPTRNNNGGAQAWRNIVIWFKGLNSDMRIALVSISLLVFLLLSVGVFALTGSFQGVQGLTNQNTPPTNNSKAPLSTATTTSTAMSTTTATIQATTTATVQATSTATGFKPTPEPTQQPVKATQPIATPVPTLTPQLAPTTEPTVEPMVPPPTTVPDPTPTATSNPWGYDFNPGQLITSPPAQFCAYFACTDNFLSGTGYIVECSDSLFSLTGGTPNACTGHGTVQATLYKLG
jgi:hypothetical protein